jgi:N-carbamoyl-L-amino-acid hydrolase
MMKKEFEVIAERRGCPIRTEEFWKVAHAPFDQELNDRVVESAEELGLSAMKMYSGAGHDMSEVNQVTRGAMIFVPSINGRSHVEVEDTPYEDCTNGVNVLLQCVLKTANEV